MFFKKNYKASFNTLDSEGVSSSLPGMAQRERSHLREGSTRGTRCRLAKDMPALLGPVSTTGRTGAWRAWCRHTGEGPKLQGFRVFLISSFCFCCKISKSPGQAVMSILPSPLSDSSRSLSSLGLPLTECCSAFSDFSGRPAHTGYIVVFENCHIALQNS